MEHKHWAPASHKRAQKQCWHVHTLHEEEEGVEAEDQDGIESLFLLILSDNKHPSLLPGITLLREAPHLTGAQLRTSNAASHSSPAGTGWRRHPAACLPRRGAPGEERGSQLHQPCARTSARAAVSREGLLLQLRISAMMDLFIVLKKYRVTALPQH